jgi:2-furoyl-CoA dehydrogenase large subunit
MATTRRWIGRPMRRVEDPHLLTGRGQYLDDHAFPDARHAAIVRSPHAHARILGYDVSAALAMPGVAGVITGADVAERTKPFGVGVTAPVRYYCAATDRVRFVGEPVALVVGRDRYSAEEEVRSVLSRQSVRVHQRKPCMRAVAWCAYEHR